MSYFNSEQQDSMKTPEERAEEAGRLNGLTAVSMARARTEGPLTPAEEEKLLDQLLRVKLWDSPDVPCFTYRLLVEVRQLREG